jgi:hypothetical protein
LSAPAGKRVKDPNAYFLKMGREEAAKAKGVPVEALKQANSRNREERANGLAAAVGAFSRPSDAALRTANRYNPARAAVALQMMEGNAFQTQAAADRAFQNALSAVRFSGEARDVCSR